MTAYLGRLYGPLTALSNVRVDVMTALVSFERVFEVLDLPPTIVDKPDAVDLDADDKPSIEFSTSTFVTRPPKRYRSRRWNRWRYSTLPCRSRCFSTCRSGQPGQLVALVGPSGAGKTTITQLVTRMYDVQEGGVFVGGHDVRDVTLESLRDLVGVVTQDAHMFHDTIRANLAYAIPDATDEELWGRSSRHIGPLVRSLPDQSRRSWVTAATGCPAGRSSGSRSRGCC